MEAWGTGRTCGKKILAFVNSHHRHIGQSNEGAAWLFRGVHYEGIVDKSGRGMAHSDNFRSLGVPEKQKGNKVRPPSATLAARRFLCHLPVVASQCHCGYNVMKQSGDKVLITANIYPSALSADAVQAGSWTGVMCSF